MRRGGEGQISKCGKGRGREERERNIQVRRDTQKEDSYNSIIGTEICHKGGRGWSFFPLLRLHSLDVSYDTLENVVEKGIQQVIHILGSLKRYRKPLKELPRTFVDQFDLRFSILCVTESRR